MVSERDESVATPLTSSTTGEVTAEPQNPETTGPEVPTTANGGIDADTQQPTALSSNGIIVAAETDGCAPVDAPVSTAKATPAAPEPKVLSLPTLASLAAAEPQLSNGLHCEAHHTFGPDEHGDSVGPLVKGSDSKQSTPRKPPSGKNGAVTAALPFQRPPMKRTSLARNSAPVPQPLPAPPSPVTSRTPSTTGVAPAADDRPPMRRTSLSRRSAPPDLSRVSMSSSAPMQSVRFVEEVPRRAVRAAIVVSFNAILMAVAEIIIEILIVLSAYPKLPFRLDFFFLTILSALLGVHTLHGVRGGHFDTSRNSLQDRKSVV